MGVLQPIPLPNLGPIQPFGLLVATGVLLGSRIVFWRSAKQGLGEEWPRQGVLAVLAGAFLLSHWVERIYYVHDPLFQTGPIEYLAFWSGMSSFGGFVGAFYGLMLFTGWDQASKARRVAAFALPTVAALSAYASMTLAQVLFPVAIAAGVLLFVPSDGRRVVFADALVEGLVPGWIFGRMGCTLVFDHPGSPSHFWLAMVYPPDGIARHNLGLYELLFTALVLLPAVLLTRRLVHRPGFLTGIVSVVYAPARFTMDFFRVRDLSGADPRYFGLTMAQFTAIVLFLGGAALIGISLVRAPRPLPEPVEPEVRPAPRKGGKKGKGKKKQRGRKKR